MSAVPDSVEHAGEDVILDRPLNPGYAAILTPPAPAFLTELHWRFDAERVALRTPVQVELTHADTLADFLTIPAYATFA